MSRKSTTLTVVAIALVAVAILTVNSISRTELRVSEESRSQREAVSGLAFGLRDSGRLDEAIAVAPSLEGTLRGEEPFHADPDSRRVALTSAALAQGQIQAALAATRSIEFLPWKATALAQIAKADPTVFPEAKSTAIAVLRQDFESYRPYAELAKGLAYRGDVEGAKQFLALQPAVARNVETGTLAFYEASGLVDRGELEAAVSRLDDTMHPSDRVTMLLTVAEKQAAAGVDPGVILAQARAVAAPYAYDVFRVGRVEDRLGRNDPLTAQLVYEAARQQLPSLLPHAGFLLAHSGQDQLADEAFGSALTVKATNASTLAYYLTRGGREGDARRIAGL